MGRPEAWAASPFNWRNGRGRINRDSLHLESGVSAGVGSGRTVDYEKTRFEDVVHDADVVFDPIGGETQKRSWKTLKKGGILVSIVAPPSEAEARKSGARSAFLSVKGGSALLAELATLVDSGKIKPMVEKMPPLSEARQAHELNETAWSSAYRAAYSLLQLLTRRSPSG